MTCIVYGLASSDGVIRYVGQTSRSIERRLRKHHENARLGVNTPLYHWMRREAAQGRAVSAVTLQSDAEYGADERRVIAEMRANGVQLLNLTDGGDGTLGWKHTPDTKAKMLAKRIGLKMNLSSEQRAQRRANMASNEDQRRASMSAAKMGCKLSQETISKRTATRRANGGYTYTPEQRAAQSARIKEWWAQRKGVVA